MAVEQSQKSPLLAELTVGLQGINFTEIATDFYPHARQIAEDLNAPTPLRGMMGFAIFYHDNNSWFDLKKAVDEVGAHRIPVTVAFAGGEKEDFFPENILGDTTSYTKPLSGALIGITSAQCIASHQVFEGVAMMSYNSIPPKGSSEVVRAVELPCRVWIKPTGEVYLMPKHFQEQNPDTNGLFASLNAGQIRDTAFQRAAQSPSPMA